MFKVNNKRTYFKPCSSVFIVNFEHVIAGWDNGYLIHNCVLDWANRENFNSFINRGPCFMETSSLIWFANQWTDFYMIGIFFMKQLNLCWRGWLAKVISQIFKIPFFIPLLLIQWHVEFVERLINQKILFLKTSRL